jgi:hypothetical protein
VPWRDTARGEVVLKLARQLDRAVFVLPPLRWQAWYCLIELGQPRR